MDVDVFVIIAKNMFVPPADNNEFVDIKWFDLEKPELFVPEMLPKNDVVIESLIKVLDELKTSGEISAEFLVDETKTNDPELKFLKGKIHK